MALSASGSAPSVAYTWDSNGNLTARGNDSFAWDYENPHLRYSGWRDHAG